MGGCRENVCRRPEQLPQTNLTVKPHPYISSHVRVPDPDARSAWRRPFGPTRRAPHRPPPVQTIQTIQTPFPPLPHSSSLFLAFPPRAFPLAFPPPPSKHDPYLLHYIFASPYFTFASSPIHFYHKLFWSTASLFHVSLLFLVTIPFPQLTS